jgi:DNA-binding SARP family transcriptional activator
MEIDINLFGKFQVRLDDQMFPDSGFRGKFSRLIIQTLAIQPGMKMRTEQLVDLLWPHLEGPNAKNRLYNTLHGIRTAFKKVGFAESSSFVLICGTSVELNSKFNIASDYSRFNALISVVRGKKDLAQRHGPTNSPAIATLEKAVALYTNDLLDTEVEYDWFSGPRQECKDRAVWALEQLVEWFRDNGEYERAIEYARRLVSIEPSNEPAHLGLMHLFEKTGHVDRALLQFTACKRSLRRDLDRSPSPDIVAYREQLLVGINSASTLDVLNDENQKISPASQSELNAPDRAIKLLKYTAPIGRVPLTGRNRELTELCAWTDPSSQTYSQLVTITGGPGIGKSRLARSVLEQNQNLYSDGVRVVALTFLNDSAGFLDYLARSLDVSFEGNSPLTSLCKFFSERSLLVLLDRFEHIASSAREVTALLKAAPNVTFLITSQVALQISVERRYQLTALTTDQLGSGADLFFSVAESVGVKLDRRSTKNTALVADICTKLGGIALAIELAAAQTQLMSLTEIAYGLDSSISFLSNRIADVERQHRSLDDAIRWSFSLLASEARAVSLLLTVFQSHFELETVKQVFSKHFSRSQIKEAIQSLVERNLIEREYPPEPALTGIQPPLMAPNTAHSSSSDVKSGVAATFFFLDSVRGVCERIVDSDPMSSSLLAIKAAHAKHFADTARELGELIRKGETGEAVKQFNAIRHEIEQSVEWHHRYVAASEFLFLIAKISMLYQASGMFEQGQKHVERALRACSLDTNEKKYAAAWCHYAVSGCLFFSGKPAESFTHLQKARHFSTYGDDELLTERIEAAWMAELFDRLKYKSARKLLLSAIGRGKQAKQQIRLSGKYFLLADLEMQLGNYKKAVYYCELSVDYSLEVYNLRSVAFSLHTLAQVCIFSGNLTRANAVLEECVPIAKRAFSQINMFPFRFSRFQLTFEMASFDEAESTLADLFRVVTPVHARTVNAVVEFINIEKSGNLRLSLPQQSDLEPYQFDSGFPDVFIQKHCYEIRKHVLCKNAVLAATKFDSAMRVLERVPNPLWYSWLFDACAHAFGTLGYYELANAIAARSKCVLQQSEIEPTPRQVRTWKLIESYEKSNKVLATEFDADHIAAMDVNPKSLTFLLATLNEAMALETTHFLRVNDRAESGLRV